MSRDSDSLSPPYAMGPSSSPQGGEEEQSNNSFPNEFPLGIPALKWNNIQALGDGLKDSKAQFPSHVNIWKFQPRDSNVRALQIWEAPLTAGPLAAVPCISGSKRSQGHSSSLS